MLRAVAAAMAAAVLGIAMVIPARAQTRPGSIELGPLKLIPSLDLSRGYDDNVFFRQSNALSSSYSVLSPALRLEGNTGQLKFDLTLRIDEGRYDKTPADNYTDSLLTANAELTFSGRAALKLRAERKHGHDPRGFTDRPVSLSPDEWDNTGAEGLFRYGAAGAQGRIEIDAASYARRYTNNRDNTAASDRDTSQLGGTFYWRAMPKTEILVSTQFRRIGYVLPSSTLSSTEDRYYLGLKWEATAATTGFMKFGQLKKTFDSADRQSFATTSWDGGVRWSPRTYSVVDLTTYKQTAESSGFGDTILSRSYNLTWTHAWSSRLRTQALASLRNDTFIGSGISRLDDVTSLGMSVGYDFRRWLHFGLQYTHTERSSNQFGLDYRRNLLLFTVGATL